VLSASEVLKPELLIATLDVILTILKSMLKPCNQHFLFFATNAPFFSAIALALASDSADSTGFREYTKLPAQSAD